MPEMWRILPANGGSPILFTNREQLDKTLSRCRDITADRTARAGQRSAARTVVMGTVQVAVRVEWVESE